MGEKEWFWEGNVVAAVARHLARDGWLVERVADTTSGEAGADIRARKAGQLLSVEAKGYPSRFYERGPKKGKPKRTNPTTQARHWYAEALLSAILRKSDNPTQRVVMAFPEFQVYTGLIRRTREALRVLALPVFLVQESGQVVLREP